MPGGGTHYASQPLPRGHVHDLHGDLLAAAALCLPCAGAQVRAADDIGVVYQVTVLGGFLLTQPRPAVSPQHPPGSSGWAFTPSSLARRELGRAVPGSMGFAGLPWPCLGRVKVMPSQS